MLSYLDYMLQILVLFSGSSDHNSFPKVLKFLKILLFPKGLKNPQLKSIPLNLQQ